MDAVNGVDGVWQTLIVTQSLKHDRKHALYTFKVGVKQHPLTPTWKVEIPSVDPLTRASAVYDTHFTQSITERRSEVGIVFFCVGLRVCLSLCLSPPNLNSCCTFQRFCIFGLIRRYTNAVIIIFAQWCKMHKWLDFSDIWHWPLTLRAKIDGSARGLFPRTV